MIVDEKLSPTERLLLGVFTILMGVAGFAAGRASVNPDAAVVQPVQFNHRKHVKDNNVDCSVCHPLYAEHEHAGLPDLSVCTTCHSVPLGKSPEEAKLIKLAASANPPAFKKLFVLPAHAYYSHRRHVTIAKTDCAACHGAIADTTAPPPRPLVRIQMQTCIDCHDGRSVRTECTACHR